MKRVTDAFFVLDRGEEIVIRDRNGFIIILENPSNRDIPVGEGLLLTIVSHYPYIEWFLEGDEPSKKEHLTRMKFLRDRKFREDYKVFVQEMTKKFIEEHGKELKPPEKIFFEKIGDTCLDDIENFLKQEDC